MLKVVAFLGVVALHCITPDSLVSKGINIVSRIGVPVFFMVSGYFALRAAESKIARRAKNIAVLIAGGSAVYLVAALLGIWGKSPASVFTQAFAPQNIIDTLTINTTDFAYHLWFLFALLYTYVLFLAWQAANRPWKLFLITFGAVVTFRFIASEVLGLIDPLSAYLRNWLCMGIPLFGLGMLVKQYEGRLTGVSSPVLAVLALAGIAVSIAEYKFFDLQELYLGIYLMAGALFVLCLKHPLPYRPVQKAAGILGGDTLMVAYICHLLVRSLLMRFTGLSNDYAVWALTSLAAVLIGIAYSLIMARAKRP